MLVGGLEARNGARVVVTGSVELLGDQFGSRTDADNGQFVSAVTKWAFGSAGRLHVSNPSVRLVAKGHETDSAKQSVMGSVDHEQRWFTAGEQIEYQVGITSVDNLVMPEPSGLHLELWQGGQLFVRKNLARQSLDSADASQQQQYRAMLRLPHDVAGSCRLTLVLDRPGFDVTNDLLHFLSLQLVRICCALCFFSFLSRWG